MIKNGRITLRHVEEADLPLLIRASNDVELRGENSPTRLRNPTQTHQRFKETGFSTDEFERLMICNEANEVVGDLCHFPAKRYADAREIGWMLYGEANRGKGYAYEAVSALIDYLFKSYTFNRIECSTGVDNAPSLRLAERCGFVREGVLRGQVFVNGEYIDSAVLSILRSEWAQRRAAR